MTTLTVLTNNGNAFGSNATLNAGSDPQCVIAADMNEDGKIDLVCAHYFAGTLMVLTNNGSGIFEFFDADVQRGGFCRLHHGGNRCQW